MGNPILLFVALLSIFLPTAAAFGQQKYEKESRVSSKDVPPFALEFVQALELSGKVKWYAEEGLDDKSFEAKFKSNHQKHSVEFDTTGVIQDVEIEMYWKTFTPALKDPITKKLDEVCTQYKVSKIQLQYAGSQSVLVQLVKGENTQETFTTQYEIIVKCVSESKAELFEYLFNEQGALLKTSKIIFKNSSNLEY